ncbi:MAG: mismatch repair protein, MutS family [Dehalococcoidia bacterium]|nr:mismatch repair protein, MutS family [Dehalococcoidia bacterium]
MRNGGHSGKDCPGPELYLRHMTVDKALYELERYLDQVFLAGLTTVRVVHGKGTGTLRRVVRETLSSHPLVDGFREGVAGEGGAGVTVVQMARIGSK